MKREMHKFLLIMSVIPTILWGILGLAVMFGFYTPTRGTIAFLYFMLAFYSWAIVRRDQ